MSFQSPLSTYVERSSITREYSGLQLLKLVSRNSASIAEMLVVFTHSRKLIVNVLIIRFPGSQSILPKMEIADQDALQLILAIKSGTVSSILGRNLTFAWTLCLMGPVIVFCEKAMLRDLSWI